MLLDADGGPGGKGAVISVPPGALGDDDILEPGESFTLDFEIGLKKQRSFDFFVDAYGVFVQNTSKSSVDPSIKIQEK